MSMTKYERALLKLRRQGFHQHCLSRDLGETNEIILNVSLLPVKIRKLFTEKAPQVKTVSLNLLVSRTDYFFTISGNDGTQFGFPFIMIKALPELEISRYTEAVEFTLETEDHILYVLFKRHLRTLGLLSDEEWGSVNVEVKSPYEEEG